MRSNLEFLRRIVRQQTNQIQEPVGNLLGPVSREVIPLALRLQESSLVVLRVPGSVTGTDLDAFYANFGVAPERSSQLLTTSEGTLVVASTEPATWLLRGTFDVADSFSAPLALVTGASTTTYAIYVDGVLLKRSTGDRALTLTFAQGRHMLEIVVAGTMFGVALPAQMQVQAVRDVLVAPTLAGVTTGYSDPAAGVPSIRVRWYNDGRVGGWIILRRELTDYGLILDVGNVGPQREFSVIVAGNSSTYLPPGTSVYAGLEPMGTVLTANYDAAATFTGNLLDNPQLTSAATGWSTSASSATRVTGVSNPVGAAAVYRVTTTDAASSGAQIQATAGRFAVTAGSVYAYSVYVDSQLNVGKTFYLSVKYYTSGAALISTSNLGPFTLAAGWQRLVASDTAPATAASAVLFCYTTAAQRAFTVDMTGAQVIPIGSNGVMPPYDSTATYTGLTLLRVRLAGTLSDVNVNWFGRKVGAGVFREVNRVQRIDNQPVLRWDDVAVRVGTVYEYALQAYGLFDATALSPVSEPLYIRAGDVTPPASITVSGGYPKVVNGQATVVFTTPADEDYAGVRVYFEDVVQTGTSPGGGAPNQFILASAAGVDVTGYFVEITGGAGTGQRQVISSVASTTCTMAAEWATPPTSTSVYRVYRLLSVYTDYGKPNTRDQLNFEVVKQSGASRYGTYRLLAFDQAGNEQDVAAAASWNFTSADETFLGSAQPPVVGVRQLSGTEQDALSAPYNDSLNYAIVELSGSDPVDGTTGVVLEYRLRGGDSGTAKTPSSSTTLFDSAKTWVTNRWINYRVEIIAGTGAGQSSVVTANGANLLTVSPAWTVTPDATSQYRLEWVTGIPATAALVLDAPRGTRGRLVAVPRTEASNWVDVRARDAAGLVSTTVAYSPDFDWSPEISTLEARIDPVADRVYVTGLVDDDCRSLEWWVNPAGAGEPSVSSTSVFTDLSQNKTFAFDFSLNDGVRKTLTLRPWGGAGKTGVEGIDVKREFSRTPRSTLLLEPRTASGAVSTTVVRATANMSPAPSTQVTGTVTSATATTLTDSTKNWNAGTGAGDGQFERFSTVYRQYYVKITGGNSGVGQIRAILRNTSTQLVLETPWTVVPDNTNTYEIVDGAVWFRTLASASDISTPFTPTSGVEYVTRNADAQYVEYYAALSGSPPEAVQRALIDQDSLPEITSITVAEVPASWLTVSLGPYDDDTKRWRLYARKGAFPVLLNDGTTTTNATVAASPDARLDMTYLRADIPITHAKDVSFAAGSGTWYLIVVGESSYGDDGPRVTATKTVVGVQDTTARVSSLRVERQNTPGYAYNWIRWSHNTTLDSPATGFTVRVYAYRADLGPQTEVELVGSPRAPFTDALSAVASEGSILHQVPNAIDSGTGGVERTWVYTVKLYEGLVERQVIQTAFTTTYNEFYEPTLVGPLTVTLDNGGNCVYNPGGLL